MKQLSHPVFKLATVPLGRLAEWKLAENPNADRIATREIGWDYTAYLYPTRQALAKHVQKAERTNAKHDRPVVPLTDGEGY